jgi:hypothetical protein
MIERILIMDADIKAKKRSKDMKEGFKTVLQIMITKIKSLIMVEICQSMTSGRSPLFSQTLPVPIK